MISPNLILIFVLLIFAIIVYKIWEYRAFVNRNVVSDEAEKDKYKYDEEIRQKLSIKSLVLSDDGTENNIDEDTDTDGTTSTDIESQIEVNPTQLHSNIEQCAICLSDFENGSSVSVSSNKSCQHIFHVDCIVRWLVRESGCPCCREEYLTTDVLDITTSEVSVEQT